VHIRPGAEIGASGSRDHDQFAQERRMLDECRPEDHAEKQEIRFSLDAPFIRRLSYLLPHDFGGAQVVAVIDGKNISSRIEIAVAQIAQHCSVTHQKGIPFK